MARFDRLVIAAVLGLGLVIAGLSVALARLGPTVDTAATATTLDGTLANTQIAVTFSQPMRIRTVEQNFRIDPKTKGSFSWSGNEMLFIPSESLVYSRTYTVTVRSGAEDTSGKHLGRTFRYSFTTQGPHLMFLGSGGSERGRLILATIGGGSQVVGADDGLVTSFSVSQDRSLVVYVKRGAPNERPDELWLLNLTDNSTQRIFRRPDWSLTQPHLSPDDRYVVFLATNVSICPPDHYYKCYRDTTGPLVYFLDVRSLKSFPFRSTSDVPITNFIDFSPTGQVAYTDLGSALVLADPNGAHIVHIPNLGNALEYSGFDPEGDKAVFVGQTPSSTGGDILVYTSKNARYTDVSSGVYDSSTPAFSSSGTRVAYAAYRGEKGIEPLYGINVYDLRSGHTRKLTAEKDWSDWTPSWSLDDSYIAFVRTSPQEAMYLGSGEIWVMRSDGSQAHPIGLTGQQVVWVS